MTQTSKNTTADEAGSESSVENSTDRSDVLDRVLRDIQSAGARETTAHSSYVSGVFEDGASSDVLDRVLKDIESANARDTTAHSSYVSGVFED